MYYKIIICTLTYSSYIRSVLQYENNMEECPSNHRAHIAKVCEIATRDLGSSLMYRRYDELFHHPSAWMVESSKPADTAAVAVPIRKLWPQISLLTTEPGSKPVSQLW